MRNWNRSATFSLFFYSLRLHCAKIHIMSIEDKLVAL